MTITKPDRRIYYTILDSPLGPIRLTSNGQYLTGLYMDAHKYSPPQADNWVEDSQAVPFPEAVRQLAAYFNGIRTEFDLPLAPSGTSFQQHVWKKLLAIPYGVTTTYGELAKSIGNSGASRAVGLANGRNPISIIVPCHRVIGSGGKLTGYGGGLPRKAALLSFEFSVLIGGPQPFPSFETPVGASKG